MLPLNKFMVKMGLSKISADKTGLAKPSLQREKSSFTGLALQNRLSCSKACV